MLKQGVNSNGELIRDTYTEPADPCNYEFICDEDGMTRQEFADECDINTLMATYEKTGVINHIARSNPDYFDASEIPDLQSALTMMKNAETAFMSLPAIVRREFDNNAVLFTDFAANPENIDQMRSWGLAPPLPSSPGPLSPVPEPSAAPAASSVPPAGAPAK